MIAAVNPAFASAWPSGWEDVEVVDSVLVAEPAAPGSAAHEAWADQLTASVYDGSGRVASAGRFGRLVSVLA
jgi:hypothetical protein